MLFNKFVSFIMHDPRVQHMAALHRILHYVRGTIDHGLQLYKSSISSLLSYTDVDWGGCPDTRRSTSDYCVFLGDNLVSWCSKRQPTVSRSSVEAEYRGVANVVSETCWIRNLLLELHCPIPTTTLVYCDNVSAIYLPPTRLIINALNILRWIFILFVKRSNVVMFGFFMYLHVIKLQIYSSKTFLKFFLMIFFLVSAFANFPIRLWGCNRVLSLVSLEYFVNILIMYNIFVII